MNAILEKIVVNHVMALPVMVSACVTVGIWVDRGICFLLRFFTASQIDSAIDAVAAAAKARVDADAKAAAIPPK